MRTPTAQERAVERTIRRRTIFSFAIFILAGFAAWAVWQWVHEAPRRTGDAAIYTPLRAVHRLNERLFSATFSATRLAKEYPLSKAEKKVRVNGTAGMSDDFDPAGWKLGVARSPGDTFYITLADIQALPKTEIVFDFKCIEGWSQVTHWGGVRFADFVRKYGLEAQAAKKYIGLTTPDRGYYVGVDMPSALQKQTLLCYEMNDAPLPMNQGAPLRLIIPVKYGIKHLKRIGTLYFSDVPPPDYWAERGYDYYSGH